MLACQQLISDLLRLLLEQSRHDKGDSRTVLSSELPAIACFVDTVGCHRKGTIWANTSLLLASPFSSHPPITCPDSPPAHIIPAEVTSFGLMKEAAGDQVDDATRTCLLPACYRPDSLAHLLDRCMNTWVVLERCRPSTRVHVLIGHVCVRVKLLVIFRKEKKRLSFPASRHLIICVR